MENYNEMTDEKLVSLYAEGNCEAFDELLSRTQDRIFQYIYMMVKGNQFLADDLFQDTYVRCITAIRDGRYVENGSFFAWLLRVARNLVLDHFRAQKNAPMSQQVYDEEGELKLDVLNQTSLSEPDAEFLLLANQSREEVRCMIEKLPDNQREVVYMRFYEDLSFKEIAQLTGVSINTALGRMHYAVHNLRRMASDRDLYMAV